MLSNQLLENTLLVVQSVKNRLLEEDRSKRREWEGRVNQMEKGVKQEMNDLKDQLAGLIDLIKKRKDGGWGRRLPGDRHWPIRKRGSIVPIRLDSATRAISKTAYSRDFHMQLDHHREPSHRPPIQPRNHLKLDRLPTLLLCFRTLTLIRPWGYTFQ